MGFGAFAGGLSQGLNNGMKISQAMEDAEDRKLDRADKQLERDGKKAVNTAMQGGLDAANAEAARLNSQTVESSYGLESAYNVPGVGVTRDADFAKSQAADQEFIDGKPVNVEQGYSAPGVGFTKDFSGAQSLAAGQDMEGLKIARPGVSSADLFWKKFSGETENRFISLGQLDKAKSWRDYRSTRQADEYGRAYADAALNMQNPAIAGPKLEDLYNQRVPDGKFVKVTPSDGGQFTITTYDEQTGKPVNARTMAGDEMVQMGMHVLSPVKLMEWQLKNETEKTKKAAELAAKPRFSGSGGNIFNNTTGEVVNRSPARTRTVNGKIFSITADENGEDVATEIASAPKQFNSSARSRSSAGGLTVPQQRADSEIDAARQALSGMSRDEVLRKTQAATATGRTNPEYDPQLASRWKLANRKKYGEDPGFDQLAQQQPQPSLVQELQRAKQQGEIGKRFAADPSMKGRRMGKVTPQGQEVLDSNGRLIGHYK